MPSHSRYASASPRVIVNRARGRTPPTSATRNSGAPAPTAKATTGINTSITRNAHVASRYSTFPTTIARVEAAVSTSGWTVSRASDWAAPSPPNTATTSIAGTSKLRAMATTSTSMPSVLSTPSA